MSRADVMAAVLAGGRGRRMGAAKATTELAGRPLVGYPLAALAEAGLETVVVAKRDTPLPELDVPVWHEPDEPVHPLAGIVAALERAQGRTLVVVACDMPFLTGSLLSHLAALDVPLAMAAAGGRLHPLLGRYAPALEEALVSCLAAGGAIHELITRLEPLLIDEAALREFGDPERLLLNVNTPADLARASALLEGGA
jgi:molybdopterin-guanine dinucleotide biosynthesis protein A